MLLRSLVVISCYLLSLLGAVYAVMGVAALLDGGSLLGAIVIIVWFFAASALMRMSYAWIHDIRLGPRYSGMAFFSGIGALVALPILGALDSAGAWPQDATNMFAAVTLLEAILVLPSIALATYLNWFHATPGD